MPGNVTFSGTLPGNICASITDEYTRFQAYVAALIGVAPASSGVHPGVSPPTDHSLTWLKLTNTGYPVRFYFYMGGWCSLHPMVPGSTIIWTQSGGTPVFTSFDGGDASSLSPTSGPMWEINTDIHGPSAAQLARVPMSVGNLPNDGTPVSVGIGDTGGSDLVKLTGIQVPQHKHFIAADTYPAGASSSLNLVNQVGSYTLPSGSTADYLLKGTGIEATIGLTSNNPGNGDVTTGNDPVSVLPPYVGVLFLRRTARLYYYQAP